MIYRVLTTCVVEGAVFADNMPSPAITTGAFFEWIQRFLSDKLFRGQRGDLVTLDQAVSAMKEHAASPVLFRHDIHPQLAEYMMEKRWLFDVMALPIRRDRYADLFARSSSQLSRRNQTFYAPTRRAVERLYKACESSRGLPPLRSAELPPLVLVRVAKRHRFTSRAIRNASHEYNVDFLMDCVLLANHLRRVDDAREASSECLRAALGSDGQRLLEVMDHEGFRWPSKQTLLFAKVRIDFACMLANRQLWSKSLKSPSAAHESFEVLCDASRAFGREVLACRLNILSFAHGVDRPTVHMIRLPTLALGHRHMGVVDKAMTFLQSLWMMYGPDKGRMEVVLKRIRVAPTDLGTEASIINARNILPFFYNIPPTPQDETYLLPLALRVIGWNHLCDGLIKSATSHLHWFPTWLQRARHVVSFLYIQAYSDVLEAVLLKKGRDDCLRAMKKRPERFLELRWGSSCRAAWDLLAFKDVLRFGCDAESFNVDSETAKAVMHCASDDVEAEIFWQECEAISVVCGPIENLRRWGRGCAICEPLMLKGKSCQCGLQGRRLKQAWGRIQECHGELTMAKLAQHMVTWHASVSSSVPGAMDGIRGLLALKTDYLDRLPYLVARLRESGVAARCLERYDAISARGADAHRVSKHFCDRESPLRASMEHLALSGEMRLDLAREALPYEWGLLDESMVEGESMA